MAKTMPRPEGSLGEKYLRGNIPPDDMEPINPTVTDLSGIGAKYQEDQTYSSILRYQSLTKNKGEPSYEGDSGTQPMVITYANVRAILLSADEAQEKDNPTSSTAPHTKASDTDSSSDKIIKKYDDTLPLTKQKLLKYLKKVDQTDKLVEASISSFEKSSTTINDLYKGLNGFDFYTLLSTVKDHQTHVVKQDEQLAGWAKSSTNMAWNLGFRVSGLKRAQNHIKSSMSSLQEDISSIKSMMTKMYNAFRGQYSSAPSGSVTLTLALTHISANVEGDNATHTATKELPKLVKASSIVRPDPDEPVKVEFIINGKTIYLTKQEIHDYWDKEEQIKKAEEEDGLNAISKPKVIKVVHDEAKKLGIHPKEVITTKAGELFKKAKDVEHAVFKRQHTEKVRKSLELRNHKLKKIFEELEIHSALLAPAPEQASSQTSGRKRKHIELEPETRISGLECNQALPENVPFVNNMVIEEPEYGIFFTDEFGDQAFQRWSDIEKVGMEALVSYLVASSMVKSCKVQHETEEIHC
ncbi:hypothetical protein Tco_0726812 [Tanacetum coccineum]|uniref:Uncharacterized protein n=1 Tax=Tanacetum coccineum TaxID=301880 RepID=A0ABQ4YHP0_9ASTR